jgi:hypothetical protein
MRKIRQTLENLSGHHYYPHLSREVCKISFTVGGTDRTLHLLFLKRLRECERRRPDIANRVVNPISLTENSPLLLLLLSFVL